jgi:uncharacterized protein GlcG (DUF336 family)
MTRLPRLLALARRREFGTLLDESLSPLPEMPVSVRLSLGEASSAPIAALALALARAVQLTFALPAPAEGLLDALLREVDASPAPPPQASAAALSALHLARAELGAHPSPLRARVVHAIAELERSLHEDLASPGADDEASAAVALTLAAFPSEGADRLLVPALEAAIDRGLLHHPSLGPALRHAEHRLVFATPLAA